MDQKQERIAVLVDSACDVPAAYRGRYPLYVLPLRILYSDGEFSDGVNITPDQVAERLPREIPRTSLPGDDQMREVFDLIRRDGFTHVLIVTISSGLSGTHSAVGRFAGEYRELVCHMVDSRNISIGAGMLAVASCLLLDRGMGFAALCDRVEALVPRSKVFFFLDTLEYLRKGGRIGRASAFLGGLLKLKPILTCDEDGVYAVVGKASGRKQALAKLLSLAQEYASRFPENLLAICHTQAEAAAAELKAALSDLPGMHRVAEGSISPALVVHTGPGLVGVGLCPAEKDLFPA